MCLKRSSEAQRARITSGAGQTVSKKQRRPWKKRTRCLLLDYADRSCLFSETSDYLKPDKFNFEIITARETADRKRGGHLEERASHRVIRVKPRVAAVDRNFRVGEVAKGARCKVDRLCDRRAAK